LYFDDLFCLHWFGGRISINYVRVPLMRSFPTVLILFLGSLLFSTQLLWSQSPIAIEANDFITTTVFFPSNIKKVVAPAANFQFNYENNSNIGLIKGRRGNPSNLLVITAQGYVYSFALSYAEEVSEFNFILSTDQAISKTNVANVKHSNSTTAKSPPSVETPPDVTTAQDPVVPAQQDDSTANDSSETNRSEPVPVQKAPQEIPPSEKNPVQNTEEEKVISAFEVEEDLYDVDREEYYRIYCENNYLQKTIFKRSFRQSKRIAVRLNNILVDRNEKYFVLQIENNSKREYSVAGLSFFRKSNVGQLEKIMEPLYSFNLQETIDPDSINEIVYVFKNFKIGSKEKVMVVLASTETDNVVILPLDNLLINSPSN